MKNQTMAVGGLYELCIGVPSLLDAVKYYERFGFRIGEQTSLDKKTATSLYGVESAAKVIRLNHGVADHGLIRLMEWENPVNDGLGQVTMRTVGARWSNNHTANLNRIHSHAIVAKQRGSDLHICPPGFAQFGDPNVPIKPFEELMTGVYEFSIFSDYARQCFFERIDYPSPLYGTIDEGSFFQTSQITHCGLTTSTSDHSVFDFYEKCLGLQRVLDVRQPYQEMHILNEIFDIPEGMEVHALAFDEPNSGPGDLKRSGRMLIFNFDNDDNINEMHDKSRAGVLGYSHYSWRVADLVEFRKKALETGATDVSEIMSDEFGNLSWTCIAPDGYYWLFIQS